MQKENIKLSKNFNADKIEFKDLQVNSYGGKSCWIQYEGKPILLQTPFMDVPYNISEFEDKNSGEIKYSTNLSFRGMEDNTKIKHLYNEFVKLDELLIKSAVKNSVKWFKSKYNEETVKAFYNPILKKSKDKETGEPDGKFPDTFKIKLTMPGGKFSPTAAFNTKKEDLDLKENITKGAKIKALVHIKAVWFSSGSFGITLHPYQLCIKPTSKIQGFAFIEDSDESDNEEEETSVPKKIIESDDDSESSSDDSD
jgi:hypothetical protein